VTNISSIKNKNNIFLKKKYKEKKTKKNKIRIKRIVINMPSVKW
jgi:hypothetical protein